MKSTRIFLSLLLFGTAASIHLSAAAPAAEKHPGFQARRLWSPPPGLNADVAMAYGIGQRMPVRFARFDTPFELSDRPSEDREAVSGPPWWSPRTLIFTGLAVLGIVFLSQHLYLLATHWRPLSSFSSTLAPSPLRSDLDFASFPAIDLTLASSGRL